ncbi:MAG: serpin family protein [Verrucomicrobia bacterium]|nr:serpin family protein [Verrucomicrobiota bacterium]MDA1066464.1 serpin family protein [Verrucomicrobiota bacterium]
MVKAPDNYSMLKWLTHSLLIFTCAASSVCEAQDSFSKAVNTFGIELLSKHFDNSQDTSNFVISPYSIQTAFLMAYLGAVGDTRDEIRKALHYPKNDEDLLLNVSRINEDLNRIQTEFQDFDKEEGLHPAIALNVANKLYIQRQFVLNKIYLESLNQLPASEIGKLDFEGNPDAARTEMNKWVSECTKGRIEELISDGSIGTDTRACLINTLYLKAAWESAFDEDLTKAENFWINGVERKNVQTMVQKQHFGYRKIRQGTAISIPYTGGELQFLALIPDKKNGLSDIRKSLNPTLLDSCRKLTTQREIELHFPKLILKPSSLDLGQILQRMGIQKAFDIPRNSADFSGMITISPSEYFYLGKVIHQTWLEVDELGTEAAATTGIEMLLAFGIEKKPEPLIVHIDRPFIFAIQHIQSGICLFLGYVNHPEEIGL